MTAPRLDWIVDRIATENPVAGKKLRRQSAQFSEEHRRRAEEFFGGYADYLASCGRSIGFAIDCYLKMTGDMFGERIRFLESGCYANRSYREVEAQVYVNPEVMTYHMHGLVLAQFLWPDQYRRFEFFSTNLPRWTPIGRYLEIGAGHGLYVLEAVRRLGAETAFEVIDVSPSSLEICRGLVKSDRVAFRLCNVFDYEAGERFDFVTAGEVIEHLEDPLACLVRIRDLLTDDGAVYLTTPANAPMIDHIHLFRDAEEIEELVRKAGFRIVDSTRAYADDVPEEAAIEHKLPLMWAGFLVKR